MGKTTIMRVPTRFKLKVKSIAEKRNRSMLNILEEDGTRIMDRADRLSDLFYGESKKKRRR